MKSKLGKRKGQSIKRKVGGANIDETEALNYLVKYFPDASAKAEELGEDVKLVAADMLLLHLLNEHMDSLKNRTPDWTGPIDPATGKRVKKGDKFRYYAVFVKGNTAAASRIHLYALDKAAFGSKGEHLASSSLSALNRY